LKDRFWDSIVAKSVEKTFLRPFLTGRIFQTKIVLSAKRFAGELKDFPSAGKELVIIYE